MRNGREKTSGSTLAGFLVVALAALLWGAEASAQSSSSITAFGRTVTVTGGSNQQISSGLFGGVTVTVDGTSVEVARDRISVLDVEYEIGPDGPIDIRFEGYEIAIEVDGEIVATVVDENRRENELRRLIEDAEAGDAVAQYRLGHRYRFGDGVEEELETAVHWYRKSAEQGHANGQVGLAILLEKGGGVDRDPQAARDWYEKAAAQGHAIAQGNLAVMLLQGAGGPVDKERSQELLRSAADGGDLIAAYNLFLLLRPGGEFGNDEEAAVRYLKQSAELGHAVAMERLGRLYRRGEHVAADPVQAEAYFRLAIEHDHSPARYGLADLILSQEDAPPERIEDGLALLREAAEGGDAQALNDLGVYAFEGIHREKDEAEGVALFRRAALSDNILAQRNLGLAFEYGRGVERDLEKARHWYQSAVDGGHADASSDLERVLARIAGESGATSYWYARGGETIGPVSLAELQALADGREIGPFTLIWKTGLPDWTLASGYGELAFQ